MWFRDTQKNQNIPGRFTLKEKTYVRKNYIHLQ